MLCFILFLYLIYRAKYYSFRFISFFSYYHSQLEWLLLCNPFLDFFHSLGTLYRPPLHKVRLRFGHVYGASSFLRPSNFLNFTSHPVTGISSHTFLLVLSSSLSIHVCILIPCPSCINGSPTPYKRYICRLMDTRWTCALP